MEMFTNAQIEKMFKALSSGMNCTGVVGFAVAHNYNTFQNAISDYLDKRTAIIMKYGEDDGTGSYTVKDKDKIKQANEEIAEYGKLEQTVDIMTVDESALINSGLTALQMINLDFMVKHPPKESSLKSKEEIESDDRFGI